MKWLKYDIRQLKDNEYKEYLSGLSKERKDYIMGNKNENDRKLSLMGEILVKKAVAEFCGISAYDIEIQKDQNGKPYIVNLGINISISHSGDYVVCAVDNKPIGIDIEKIRDINLNVSKRFCNTDEYNYIFSNECNMPERFFEIWTAKEAEFKRLGGGKINFKTINTMELNKKYFRFSDYLVCISAEKE